ncbi:MAG: hypothetical protein AB7N24_08995 [Dehalococcoidia bacterium]
MAILRNTAPHVSLPEDFGLGIVVAGVLISLVIVACAIVASTPTEGPKGEGHEPTGNEYIDIQPAAVPETITTQ